MDRRYYLLKVGIVLAAVATATITSGIGSTRIAHAVNHDRYSAPAKIEAAAWHTTTYVAHAIAGLLGSGSSVAMK